jgi:hypothetical protein
MKKIQFVLVIIIVFLVSGCSASMSGTVVDDETGAPIEGAVIAAKWTVTKGLPGLTYGQDYKITEAVSNKEGKFKISGTLNPFVNSPTVVIYKKGYVAWNNDYIFPDYKKRDDFRWMDNNIFRLAPFKKIYSHSLHISFFRTGFTSDLAPKLTQAYAWEDSLASKEEELLREKIKTLKPGEKQERIWKEIIQELYFEKGKGNSE